jgi:hypothetical protein
VHQDGLIGSGDGGAGSPREGVVSFLPSLEGRLLLLVAHGDVDGVRVYVFFLRFSSHFLVTSRARE